MNKKSYKVAFGVLLTINAFAIDLHNDPGIMIDNLCVTKQYKKAGENYSRLKSKGIKVNPQYEARTAIKETGSTKNYTIEPVYFNSEYSDFGAVVKGDQVIFTSDRGHKNRLQYEYSLQEQPYHNLYSVPIEKPDSYKGATLLSKGINSRFHDGPAFFGSNGKEVFITRNRFVYGMPDYSKEKENNFMIYHAYSKGGTWGALEELPFNSPDYSCGHPALTLNNDTLFFASNMPGGYGGSDIYYVVRIGSGWSEPVNLGRDINTAGDEMFPFVSSEGELYFSSNGHMGLGGLDIFMAENVNGKSFGVQHLGYPLNSSSDDLSFYLLPNGIDGYFASNRQGGKGDNDIYKFKMLDRPSLSFVLLATTVDAETGEKLSGADVVVKSSDGFELFAGKSNAQAEVEIEVNPGLYYYFNPFCNESNITYWF